DERRAAIHEETSLPFKFDEASRRTGGGAVPAAPVALRYAGGGFRFQDAPVVPLGASVQTRVARGAWLVHDARTPRDDRQRGDDRERCVEQLQAQSESRSSRYGHRACILSTRAATGCGNLASVSEGGPFHRILRPTWSRKACPPRRRRPAR